MALFFVTASGLYFLTAGIRDAKRLEQTLIDRYDWANNYIPSPDGAIPPQRVEKFIRVRQAVQTQCLDYQAVLTGVANLDKIESNQDTTASEATSMGMEGFNSAFSAGPKMIRFSNTRNQALVNEEMGMGEYLYIYLTVYGRQLASEPDSPYSGMEEAYLSPRAREEFIQILNNQLAALEASDRQTSQTKLADGLRKEIETLESGSQSSPWPDGPIGAARESLAPYQQELAELYCPGVVKIELLQKNRGFRFGG
ncbi:MAG: hypothetical protein GY712_05500 [Oceanicoccus sp.]|uniref:hypothetical protein n=1 Tax=Oceanicoccus sp. TaxID=2691044 RepID=UPI00261564D8|nr:hypothetical protein [Oceanicoccus sp.]MCP3907456.1 hypothetical protein [Oceanicoccus sp.]